MIEQALKWFYDRKGKVTYSMASRNGPSSYDCSSSVYNALKYAGLFPSNIWVGNTDSEYGDLERYGWTKVAPAADGSFPAQRGDVFLWGKRGGSAGAFGHTGMFVDADNIIHCNYGYNGISVNNHDVIWSINGSPTCTIYRYTGGTTAQPANVNNPIDQEVEVGSFIKLSGIYRADDVQMIGGIWQVRSNTLCKAGFTWDDNGIPAEPLYEVTTDSYATNDQELDVGSLFKIPGKWRVLDVGHDSGMWLAQIEWSGLKFWVDLEPATEVSSSDAGTPVPGKKTTPAPSTTTDQPKEKPKQSEPTKTTPAPTETKTSETPKEKTDDSQPVINTPKPTELPKEEKKMAYSNEDIQKLKIATEPIEKTIADLSNSDEIKLITDTISPRTKKTVYFIGDSLIGLGLLVPSLAVVLQWGDVTRVAALAGLCATAGTFLLTMFAIYKSGKQ